MLILGPSSAGPVAVGLPLQLMVGNNPDMKRGDISNMVSFDMDSRAKTIPSCATIYVIHCQILAVKGHICSFCWPNYQSVCQAQFSYFSS